MTFAQYKNNKQLSLPSIDALFTDIHGGVAPFDVVNDEGQLHIMPLKEGLLVAIPNQADALFRPPREEAERERESRKIVGPRGEILYTKPQQKDFGNYKSKWIIEWTKVKTYIVAIQKDAIQFFNLLSAETRSPNFGRQARAEFDLLGTASLTRQLRFLCCAMALIGGKPPIVIYSYSLEIQPAAVYRLGMAYQPGDKNSYDTSSSADLFERKTIDDGEMIISMKYFNYADTAYLQTGGSLLVTRPFTRESTHTPEVSQYTVEEF